MIRAWFRRWPRLGSVLLAIAVVGGIGGSLFAAGKVADLPQGYGPAQDRSATWLLGKDKQRWEDWKDDTDRDLRRFIPTYALSGLLVVTVVLAFRPPPSPPDRGFKRILLHPQGWLILLALAAGAVADVIETLLFSLSLTRLVDEGQEADIEVLTWLTRVMGVLKYALPVLALFWLLVRVWQWPRQPRRGGPRSELVRSG